MLKNNNLLACAALFALMGCDSKSETQPAPTPAKSVAGVTDSETKTTEKAAPAPAAALVETDVTAAAAKDMPGFSGTLKMKLPEGAAFSPGVGKLEVKQGDFELSIGLGFLVAEQKEKLATDTLTTDVVYIVDEKDHILYSGEMLDQKGFFVVVDTPSFGGLKSTCETGMFGTKSEAIARQVLEACQSVQYSKK